MEPEIYFFSNSPVIAVTLEDKNPLTGAAERQNFLEQKGDFIQTAAT